MAMIWDYDVKELKKTPEGRLKILERKINYGVYLHDKDKISLSDVRENWEKLELDPNRRILFHFLLWGK
jgi:hypothetical protein